MHPVKLVPKFDTDYLKRVKKADFIRDHKGGFDEAVLGEIWDEANKKKPVDKETE